MTAKSTRKHSKAFNRAMEDLEELERRQAGLSPRTAPKVRALKVEEQLQRLADWHAAIEKRPQPTCATSNEHLVDQWQLLEAADPTIRASASFILRGATHDNKPPLAQMFEYVEAGFYPPPDLLLTVLDAWKSYCLVASAAKLDLEEAFFGKPKTKAGNYAARALKQRKDLGTAFELGEYMNRGMSRDEATHIVARKYRKSEESTKKLKPIDPGWGNPEK